MDLDLPNGLLGRHDTVDENRGSYALSRSISMLVLTTMCVALRFWCRKIRGARYASDDWMLLAALFFVYAAGGANIAEVVNGLGRHSSTLTFDMQARFFMSLYVMEWFYVTSVATTKFALLLLYLRVFATGSPRFRTTVYFVATSIVLWALVLYIILAIQCEPIHAAWQPWVQAKCLSIKWIQIGNAAPNIATDLLILSLPLSQINKLKVSFAQKLSLCITFLLGGFVVLASAIRLYVLISQMDLSDATWSFLEPCTWCVIELTSGVISVCLPTFWPLIAHASNAYSRYISSRFSSRLGSSAGSRREIITIGGGRHRRACACGNGSADKSLEVLGLIHEDVVLEKRTADSRDGSSLDRPFELATTELRV